MPNNDEKFMELTKKTTELVATSGQKVTTVTNNTKELLNTTKDAIINAIDVNGNGTIDIEDIIILGMKTPGVKISRTEFLQKELIKNHSQAVVDKAICENPAKAGINESEINKIADEVIQFERLCVSGVSTILSAPGGAAMAATIPVDIAQYYGYMLRTTQKLMYLYGFPEIIAEENNQQFDSETMNILVLCLGVMYGVAGANNALKAMANALSRGVEKKLMNKALTKGTIYPFVKSISKWFSIKMTKEVFAGFFAKAIPVLGAFIGGGLTFFTFKPCCMKLKRTLANTKLSKPDMQEENTIINTITENIMVDSVINEEIYAKSLENNVLD